MQDKWKNDINSFIKLCNKHQVRMIMVGGGAVNFHGYKRHSADVDFWIETSNENFDKLILVFNEMGYEIHRFPEAVLEKKQNISIKFSPDDLDLELITNFSSTKSFQEAYEKSIVAQVENVAFLKWNVLSYDDLISSKIKAQRPKDLLDVQELKRINESIE